MNTRKTTDRILRKIEEVIEAFGENPGAAVKRSLVARLAEIADAEARLETERCIEICRARAELWSNTLAATSPGAGAREEARARSNEATYIADLLASESRYHVQ